MKILLIGDFHGKKPVIKQDFDLVLSTGDLPDNKELVKINFKYWKEVNKGKKIIDLIGKKRYISIYKKATKTSDVLLKYLNNLGKRVYLVLGNHDYDSYKVKEINHLKIESVNNKVKKLKNIKLMINSQDNIGGIQLLCFSGSYSNHFKTKRFYKSWNKRLTRLFRLKNKKLFTIFLTHDPPKGVMDKIKNSRSPINGKHAGDEVIAKYVCKHKPNIMICGHMHEYQGKARLGKTLIINPGCAHDGKYAILEVINNKVKSLKFYKK